MKEEGLSESSMPSCYNPRREGVKEGEVTKTVSPIAIGKSLLWYLKDSKPWHLNTDLSLTFLSPSALVSPLFLSWCLCHHLAWHLLSEDAFIHLNVLTWKGHRAHGFCTVIWGWVTSCLETATFT